MKFRGLVRIGVGVGVGVVIGMRLAFGAYRPIETRSWSHHYYKEKVIPPPSKGHFH